MDFADRLRDLASKIPHQLPHINSEEATKNALIMPFISALGYNVFDPLEVTPELNADVGLKKGEKVDYAILRDGKPIMLFECKACSFNLDESHASQLFRYFAVTEARFGILTNGIVYRFFSDIEEKNKMDSKPFLEFNILSFDDQDLVELKKFSKPAFELQAILATASDLKYTREIKRLMARELSEPSEEFIKFFASQVYTGRLTQTVREQFNSITKKALQQFISERVSDRLKSALEREQQAAKTPENPPTEPASEESSVKKDSGIETTEEEIQGYYIIKAILAQIVDPARITLRDQKSFCSILLDDTNRKPICRLRFDGSNRQLGLFDADRNESRIQIEQLDDIFKFAERLRDAVVRYDAKENVGVDSQ